MKVSFGDGFSAITMVVGNTHPAPKGFRLARLFVEDFLPVVEGKEGRDINNLTSDNGLGDSAAEVDNVVEKINDIQGTQQPKGGGASNPVHDVIGHALHILDTPFNRVLVLIMRFRRPVFDTVEAVNILDGAADFNLGIITHESNHSTVVPDKVFKGTGHLVFGRHGVASKEVRV